MQRRAQMIADDAVDWGMAEAIEPIIPLLKDGLAGGISLVEQNIPKLRAGMEWIVDKAKFATNIDV